ncbi:MAG TPA: BON domain-containing protein [Candidatus Angelobacter sp.]
MRRYFWVVLVSLAVAAGCNRGTRPDGQIAADVQTKIQGDNTVPDKQVTINATNGVVTLSGNVSSDAARNAAANDAAQVEGVKTVVNNLQVTPAVAQNAEPEPEQPAAREEASRPSPRKPYAAPKRSSGGGDSGLRTTVPATSATTASNPPADTYNQTPSTPPPPAAPQPVTLPAGTQISIRLNDELNSEKAQIGDVFHASISTPIQIDGRTVVPTTADVEGRVVEVKSAGRFAGQSDLVIELTRLHMNGKSYTLATDRWSKQGSSRGKATAAKVGGGAALGAIIGGLAGGGKGAAIGAAAGAGAGTGVSAATKGQQIILKPETVLNFQLQNAISVVPGASRQAMN